jgi:hypothetical protein
MTFNYSLDKTDFLNYQLYTASKSKRIIRNRMRGKIVFPVVCSIIGIWFLFENHFSSAIFFFVMGSIWCIIFPILDGSRHVKHYSRFIEENYSEIFGSAIAFEISNEFILAKENGIESKIETKRILEINEISMNIFIRLMVGQSIILPKSKIDDVERLQIKLREIAAHLNIKYNIEDNWEWK